MCRVFQKFLILFLIGTANAAEFGYARDVATWQEVTQPDKTDAASYESWYSEANFSPINWRVYSQDGKVFAEVFEQTPLRLSQIEVNNGWLIGFNQGEWGGALYWFNTGGRDSYKISGHQIIDFIRGSDGILAITGLSHSGGSGGSLIQITKSSQQKKWQATTIQKLSLAPCAISISHDGTIFIVLSGAIIAIDRDKKLTTLLTTPELSGLFPNSSAISADGSKLYVGMRQFIGELDFTTRKLRYLVPDKSFIKGRE